VGWAASSVEYQCFGLMRMAGPGSGEEEGKRVRETKTLEARGVVRGVGWSQKGRSLPNVRLGDAPSRRTHGRQKAF
jgi:hypothetical protein